MMKLMKCLFGRCDSCDYDAFSAMPASIPAMLQMPAAVEAAEIEPRADVDVLEILVL